MPENKSIFRKKAIDKVSSPELLNEYIKAASPGMWTILLAIVVFLVGVIVFGSVGRLETTVKGVTVIKNSNAEMYVSEKDVKEIKCGQTVRIDGSELKVIKIGKIPVEVNDGFDKYIAHKGGFKDGEWVYKLTLNDGDLSGGIYRGEVITDSVSALSFVIN